MKTLEDAFYHELEEGDPLTCTRCGVKQEFYRRIVYSQGSRVCIDCKKITQESDNRAFDNYIYSR